MDSEPTLKDSVLIKTEPRKSSDGEDEVDGLAPTTENSTKLQSPKRKLNGEAHHEGTEVLRLHSKIPRASESPNAAAKKLHPDPLGLLIRAFPSQCRSVLELVLQGCGGNVVQAIECLLQNQGKKTTALTDANSCYWQRWSSSSLNSASCLAFSRSLIVSKTRTFCARVP